MMNVTLAKPPNYDEIVEKFGKENAEKVVFTYGNTIYNPNRINLETHLLVHEQTHGKQQNYDNVTAKLWWMRYFEDPTFRIDQEVEAYHAQYKVICKEVRDRNMQAKYLQQLAAYLSGDIYGNAISFRDARARIKTGNRTVVDSAKKV